MNLNCKKKKKKKKRKKKIWVVNLKEGGLIKRGIYWRVVKWRRFKKLNL